jgi:hypothetical protein
MNGLPDSIGEIEYTERHMCTALIYEFEKPEFEEAITKVPGDLQGREHLLKAGLWDSLKE